MKIHEVKMELEKVSKYIPELRHDLDEAYKSGEKKRRLKLLWKEYEGRYKDIMNSAEGKKLQ